MAAVDSARAHAQVVLRVRGLGLAAAALPAAVAAVLLAGRFTGRIARPGAGDPAGVAPVRWVVCAVAPLALLLAGLTARAYRRALPPRIPAGPLERVEAPE
ncbi:membrane protein, partial [Streptomyces rubellomurinus subsp. indigoferus]